MGLGYDPYLVALSILIATLGGYIALELGDRVATATAHGRRAWLAAAALAMGGGIWSMHFVGMLALRTPVPISYEASRTALSLLVAVLATGAAFFWVGRPVVRRGSALLGGLFMGCAIAGMHYLGMSAMRMPALMSFVPSRVLLSVAIAVAASTVGLSIAFRRHSLRTRLLAALVLGVAVAGMHYTGMWAAEIGSAAEGPGMTIAMSPAPDAGVGQGELVLGVAAATFGSLLLALLAVTVSRRRAEQLLSDLNATLEARVADRTQALEREQQDRLAAEEQLRQSQKMEAVGQLTGGLAHDFNNLLTGISGSLELLERRLAQGRYNDLPRYISAAQGSARRAAALTHRLLAFSRRQTLEPTPTRVDRLIADMEDLIRRTVGPEITVEVVGTAGLWLALVDPPQLENSLLNLCINARDAMPGGGRITIETANKWLDERAAAERELVPGQYLALCVTDTGTGMTPDVAARAFDPFFTTKPIGHGTGLGLSMIYGFARQSGGHVRIYSEPGQGSTICIYLPRHHGTAADSEITAPPPATMVAGQGQTVVVVDDEPTVRMLVVEVLEELGYTAFEANDGPSGLRLLQCNGPVDLLITDVGLPGGLNGRQLADAARQIRPGLKVLFITGYAESAIIGHGHLDPGMHVVTKPFVVHALAERIKALIEAG